MTYCNPIKTMAQAIFSSFGEYMKNFTKALSKDDLSQKAIILIGWRYDKAQVAIFVSIFSYPSGNPS